MSEHLIYNINVGVYKIDALTYRENLTLFLPAHKPAVTRYL
jgi:hypothetical protein